MSDTDRLLRRTEVEAQTGLSRASIYKGMRAGTFPLALRIGPKAVRWKQSEISEFVAALPRAHGIDVGVNEAA